MKRLFQIYVFGQWHIAISAAVLYTGMSQAILGHFNWYLTAHVFGATLFIYLLHRIYGRSDMDKDEFNRYKFLKKHQLHAQITALAGGFMAAITFLFLPRPSQLLLIVAGLVSISYIVPLIFRKRLRDIGIFKIFAISLAWAIIPLLSSLGSVDTDIFILLLLEGFCFIFALTIPFDVRDQSLDQREQVSNLTNALSISKLQLIIGIFLIVTTALLWFLFQDNIVTIQTTILLTMLYLLQFAFTIDLNKDHGEMFFLFLLDGIIMIKGVVLFFVS